MAYHKYTREILEAAVRESTSTAQVLVKLGIRISGGAHAHIKRRIVAYEIDTSHFLGQAANREPTHRGGPERKTAAELLILAPPNAPPVTVGKIRRALLETGRAHRCAACGLGPEWQGNPLVLEIDHISGQRNDNRPENLRFLCPNCHSQTVNFGKRKLAEAGVAKRQTRRS